VSWKLAVDGPGARLALGSLVRYNTAVYEWKTRDRDTPYRKLIDLSLPRGSECGSSRKASVNNASFNWINVKCGRRSCHSSKQARCGDPKENKIRVGRKVRGW